nr:C4-dicarboxylate TRAP transporter substrate-binding protein [Sneathiella sp.]
MKKSLISTTAAFCAMGIGISLAHAETKLTYGSFIPAEHIVHKMGLQPYFDRTEQDTGGSITWQLFPGGAVGGVKEALKIVETGSVDSSLIIDVYIKKDLPASVAVSNLLTLNDDPLVFAGAVNEFQLIDCAECEAEREAHNIKALGYYSTGISHLMCGTEIASLEDVQGKKIRAASRQGALASHLGGTPVSITTAEMYEAIQRGVADCTIGSAAWLNAYNLKDVIKTIVDMPTGAYFSALFLDMNQDKWDELSAEEKQTIIKHAPKAVADIVFAYKEEGDAAIQAALDMGAKLVKPDQAMLDAVKEFQVGEVKISADAAKEDGLESSDALLTTFMEKVEKWRGIVASTGGDKDKYEEALWTEVFSKLN